jgi:glutathione S-transferase
VLLYDSRASGNCYKVRLALAHLRLVCELHEVDVVDRSGRAELLGHLNPALRVPVLVLDDGRALAESNAIISYLADGSHLAPSEPFARAQVLQWLFFEQYSHEPNIAVVIFWVAYATDPPPHAEIEARRALGHVALEAIERHLSSRSFLVAEKFTIADIALYAYTHCAQRGGFDLDRYPAIGRWLQRIAAQEGHVPMDAPQPK